MTENAVLDMDKINAVFATIGITDKEAATILCDLDTGDPDAIDYINSLMRAAAEDQPCAHAGCLA